MAANYLHGVETVEVERGPRPVRTVKSAVIGLIGTAPIGAVNETILCLSEKDARFLSGIFFALFQTGIYFGNFIANSDGHGVCSSMRT